MRRSLAGMFLLVALAVTGCGGDPGEAADFSLSPSRQSDVAGATESVHTGAQPPQVQEEEKVTNQAEISTYTWSHGGVIRGPRERKRIALIFTGGDFGDGLMSVLDTLREHRAEGSFFFTGDFYRNPEFKAGIQRALEEGHYLGPHSDEHLLYAPWEDRSKTLVSREEFVTDLEKNLKEMDKFGISRARAKWWIPPYEWYNEQIAQWSAEMGMRLFNFTPGTISNSDYMEDDDPRFKPSDMIFRNILDYEANNADGLNGFLLLIHQGASPKRTDKFYTRLDKLMDELELRGYEFVPVDEMLDDAPTAP